MSKLSACGKLFDCGIKNHIHRTEGINGSYSEVHIVVGRLFTSCVTQYDIYPLLGDVCVIINTQICRVAKYTLYDV